MGQATSQIEAHIENTREDLGSNLRELEQKVKSATDWKQHFRKSPMTLLGVAFGGGILVATMLGGRKGRRGERSYRSGPGADAYTANDHPTNKAFETWDNIKGALIGVAATRFKDLVGEVVPGFQDELSRREEKARSGQVQRPHTAAHHNELT